MHYFSCYIIVRTIRSVYFFFFWLDFLDAYIFWSEGDINTNTCSSFCTFLRVSKRQACLLTTKHNVCHVEPNCQALVAVNRQAGLSKKHSGFK